MGKIKELGDDNEETVKDKPRSVYSLPGSGFKNSLEAISSKDREELKKVLKEDPHVQIKISGIPWDLGNIVGSALAFSLINNNLRLMQTLLDIGMGNHPEFLKKQPLYHAIKNGDTNLISMLKKDSAFCESLKGKADLESRIDPPLNKLYMAILEGDLPTIKDLPSSKLFKKRNLTITPIEFAFLWESENRKVLPLLRAKGEEEIPRKLLECFQAELKDQKEFNKDLQNKLIDKVVDIFAYLSIDEKEKQKFRKAAVSMVQEVAEKVGLPPAADLQKSFWERIKDVITRCLTTLGFLNTGMERFAQNPMGNPELQDGLVQIRKQISPAVTNTMSTSSSPHKPSKTPEVEKKGDKAKTRI